MFFHQLLACGQWVSLSVCHIPPGLDSPWHGGHGAQGQTQRLGMKSGVKEEAGAPRQKGAPTHRDTSPRACCLPFPFCQASYLFVSFSYSFSDNPPIVFPSLSSPSFVSFPLSFESMPPSFLLFLSLLYVNASIVPFLSPFCFTSFLLLVLFSKCLSISLFCQYL